MTRRPASRQAEKARTAKALRSLPVCEWPACQRRGMGYVDLRVDNGATTKLVTFWVCPAHAQEAQRAQREKRT